MKVAPVGTREKSGKIMQKYSKADQYLLTCIQVLVYFFGLAPYKYNKETWEISFRWISSTTISTLIRLVVFNAPFSFLPLILWAIYGPGVSETADTEDNEDTEIANATTNSTASMPVNTANESTTIMPVVFLVVHAVEYVSCYSIFIL